MQFVYHPQAGLDYLKIENELYKYLFKVRRHAQNDLLYLRNLQDGMLYSYKIIEISKRDARVQYINQEEKHVISKRRLHLAWCVVDPKTIEKELPYLNELGVDKISFIYADYSQKNFKLNFEKFEKIVINSCQQCGRTSLIEFEEYANIDTFLQHYPNTFMLNFSTQHINEKKDDITTIIIGCEGGFSKREVELFDASKIVGVKSNLILRSETAVTAVASKLLV
jgi:16S rRNA (uracil1498-N3)-methyltransferase